MSGQKSPPRPEVAVDTVVSVESGPAGWHRVSLIVAPDGSAAYATGGDRLTGDGDMPYPGYEIVRKWMEDAKTLEKIRGLVR